MTTGITTISQDTFSRIDTLLAHARETTEAKRSSLDATGSQTTRTGQTGLTANAPVPTAEADLAYSAVMDMLSAPSGDAHRSLDPERVARLLDL
ncbi:hypothetical protein [Nitratidesulfovibrio liaohensis]|uniref:Uncharacterized protein n=1 Tax=Nitratidesulfovibrio liaohensis TaxID=2604158 RepID=A0ABY9QYX0_9BACT|nr:hypothetical protein [Nitratidesulfovibrio liaohensis]WMW64077.1 hypothetical protein KPS_002059 [Nitratidesulfovibrio liaohensis]